MVISKQSNLRVSDQFFGPMVDALKKCQSYQRRCPSLSDQQWLKCALKRVIFNNRSGRDFLQTLAEVFNHSIGVSHFFETLKSKRRNQMVAAVNHQLHLLMNQKMEDPFKPFAKLNKFDVYAGDGHYLEHACHDQEMDGKKYGVGHFFYLNLRTHAMGQLTLGDLINRKKEHDIRALKRQSADRLRLGAAKGRKVIWVWDRACIDFASWHYWKQKAGVYFVSLLKENMALECTGEPPINRDEAINQGVESDRWMVTSQHVMVRQITYLNPVDDKRYVYLTSEMTLEPGLIALLYKLRWEIEKVFDQTKNKLEEKKSWSSNLEGKAMQGELMAIAHNLLVLYEKFLATEYQIQNVAEVKRRQHRLEQIGAQLTEAGLELPYLYQVVTRFSQRSYKFIRWLRNHLIINASLDQALCSLRKIYAVL